MRKNLISAGLPVLLFLAGCAADKVSPSQPIGNSNLTHASDLKSSSKVKYNKNFPKVRILQPTQFLNEKLSFRHPSNWQVTAVGSESKFILKLTGKNDPVETPLRSLFKSTICLLSHMNSPYDILPGHETDWLKQTFQEHLESIGKQSANMGTVAVTLNTKWDHSMLVTADHMVPGSHINYKSGTVFVRVTPDYVEDGYGLSIEWKDSIIRFTEGGDSVLLQCSYFPEFEYLIKSLVRELAKDLVLPENT